MPLGKGSWKGAEPPKEEDQPRRGFPPVHPLFVLHPSSTEHPRLGPGSELVSWVRASGPGNHTEGLGWRPHGEGRGRRGVQGSGAEAGRGQQAVSVEEAGKEQEQLRPGQALPHADAAACRGNQGTGYGLQACPSQGCAREPGQFPGAEGEGKLWEGKGGLERGRSESK